MRIGDWRVKSGENVTISACFIPREAIPAFTERIVRHGYAAPVLGKPPDRKARSRGFRGKGRSSKRKGNRRCPFIFAPAARAARSRRSQAAKSPARQRRIANATRLHHEKGAGKWAAAQPRRIAYATRVHQKATAAYRQIPIDNSLQAAYN